MFVCTTGETVALSSLCDGNADCSNGNDETSPICESKKVKYNWMVVTCARNYAQSSKMQ